MHYLNPNQMKPNCFTYCKSNTKIIHRKLFSKYFLKYLRKNISKYDFSKFIVNKTSIFAKLIRSLIRVFLKHYLL